jgi:ATP-dependent RNA helicase DHX8/PRP22
MADIVQLAHLNMVSKVLAELERYMGFSDRDLAEFLIAQAKLHVSQAAFESALKAEEVEVPPAFVASVLRIVSAFGASGGAGAAPGATIVVERSMFPALSTANTGPVPLDGGIEDRRPVMTLKAPVADAESAGHKRSRMEALSTEDRPPQRLQAKDALELYGIYEGRVSNIKDFGAFVEIEGLKTRSEGLVYVGNMKSGARVNHPMEVVNRGQRVKVKVISIAGSKVGLSMKDVDQVTGRDLMPDRQAPALEAIDQRKGHTPHRTEGSDADTGPRRLAKRVSSPERFEQAQLIASGVLPVTQYPSFNDETGILPRHDDAEEEFEVEIVEDEPMFLAGQMSKARDMSPVKLVANPDGTLQRAAMTQSALSKERREIKEQQRNQLLDAIPTDIGRAWADPLATAGERHLAQGLRGVNMGLTASAGMPEWKAKSVGKDVAFGQRSSLPIKEQRESLPIFKLRSELLAAITDNQILVVIGETGSGKTTQMSQYLIEAGYGRRGIIGCTQPRRVAAMSVSKRVAEEMGVRLGAEVGYSIRFEDCTSPETVIKYMTDGMLMREYLMDELLTKYTVMILDEAHERTIHTDILFGLLKALCKKRPDFKLIVTSATMDAMKFSKYFFECPIFTIPGRTFKVEIFHAREPESDYLDAALITVMQIHLREPPGDILMFLTGQEEIDTACEVLFERMKSLQAPGVPELMVLPVYGALPSEMQSKIFDPAPPLTRKCVIATNIAEASLTIDGIFYVVDPGFCKQKVYNPKTGMDSLVVVPISRASAKQRAGRAGRTGPGKCYRLYTEVAFKTEMLDMSIPEIQRTNLSNVVLQLKAMGVNDLLHFDFMDPPPPQTLINALNQLYVLGALDDEGLLTKLGRKMAEFPLEPQLSTILLKSVELGCSDEVLTVVAMLSVENVFYRPKDKAAQADQKKARFHQAEGDHITFLVVYEGWKAARFSDAWCFENFVQVRAMKRAQDVRKQLLGIMDRYKLDVISCGRNFSKVCKAIIAGFFMNVAKKDPTEGYRTIVDGQPVYIHPSSALFNQNPEWILYHELVLTTKEYTRNVMLVDPKWLVELAPRFYKPCDPGKISKAKRRVRIEPLYDRFNPPDTWRLTKRNG